MMLCCRHDGGGRVVWADGMSNLSICFLATIASQPGRTRTQTYKQARPRTHAHLHQRKAEAAGRDLRTALLHYGAAAAAAAPAELASQEQLERLVAARAGAGQAELAAGALAQLAAKLRVRAQSGGDALWGYAAGRCVALATAMLPRAVAWQEHCSAPHPECTLPQAAAGAWEDEGVAEALAAEGAHGVWELWSCCDAALPALETQQRPGAQQQSGGLATAFGGAAAALVGALRLRPLLPGALAAAACAAWQAAARAAPRRALVAAGAVEALAALAESALAALQQQANSGEPGPDEVRTPPPPGVAATECSGDQEPRGGQQKPQQAPPPPSPQQELQQQPQDPGDAPQPPCARAGDFAPALSAALGALSLLVLDAAARRRLLAVPGAAALLVRIAEAPDQGRRCGVGDAGVAGGHGGGGSGDGCDAGACTGTEGVAAIEANAGGQQSPAAEAGTTAADARPARAGDELLLAAAEPAPARSLGGAAYAAVDTGGRQQTGGLVLIPGLRQLLEQPTNQVGEAAGGST